MNNYYFTASKWYGPITDNRIYFHTDKETLEYYLSLPSGDSLIPEFAGMVKEEKKDFKWEIHCDEEFGCTCSIVGLDSEKCSHPYKVAVPIAEEKLSWQEEVIAREEEGKQTFSEADMIGFAAYFRDKTSVDCLPMDYAGAKRLLNIYLKTKQ